METKSNDSDEEYQSYDEECITEFEDLDAYINVVEKQFKKHEDEIMAKKTKVIKLLTTKRLVDEIRTATDHMIICQLEIEDCLKEYIQEDEELAELLKEHERVYADRIIQPLIPENEEGSQMELDQLIDEQNEIKEEQEVKEIINGVPANENEKDNETKKTEKTEIIQEIPEIKEIQFNENNDKLLKCATVLLNYESEDIGSSESSQVSNLSEDIELSPKMQSTQDSLQ